MKKLGIALVAASAAVVLSAAPALAAPDGGANGGCGSYCPNIGNPSMNGGENNGNHYGRPPAGTAGNSLINPADFKYPPGQAPDGGDHNNGYECDGNQGIAKENPAHTGCEPVYQP